MNVKLLKKFYLTFYFVWSHVVVKTKKTSYFLNSVLCNYSKRSAKVLGNLFAAYVSVSYIQIKNIYFVSLLSSILSS